MKILSDGVLPSNYLSWRDVGKAEGINLDRLENTAKTTHSLLTAKCIEMGFPSFKKFAAFYNAIPNNLITDREFNKFHYHARLAPIAHLFRLFVANRISRDRTDCSGGNVYEVADFGILHSHYEFFKKHGKPPEVANRGRTRKNPLPAGEHTRSKIEFKGGGALDIPKNEVYTRLRDGITAANAVSERKVTVPEIALLAFSEYMERRPEVFGKLEQKPAPDALIRKKNNKRLTVDASPEIVGRMFEVIQRYNSANAVAITASQFVEMAIQGMIERLPLEYVDPELAKQLKEREEKA